MVKLQRITTADQDLYRFMEQLMIASFPPEEYRALDQLRLYTDTKPAFHNNIIFDENAPVGFFTYWDFGTFCYGEHFAIDPARRNGGYGHRALETLAAHVHPLPIVLEVEMPEEEMAQRRINFYRRNGYTLWSDKPYRQPPYKPGDDYLPMLLMAYGNIDPDQTYETVRDCIYREVYGVQP